MTLRETSLPLELLHLREGETVVGYQILAGQITFKVVSVTETEAQKTTTTPRKNIRDWINKWAGTMELEPGETRESLRAAAMQEKFGS